MYKSYRSCCFCNLSGCFTMLTQLNHQLFDG
jgi:hypothetical protein